MVPLAEARERSLEARRLLKTKIGPIQERNQTSSILSFDEEAREVHRINAPSWRNAKHSAQFISDLGFGRNICVA